VLLLAAPTSLWAAEGGVLSINTGLAIWTWVLFLLTLGVLSWKAFPAIAKGLERRQSNIQAAIDSAREDRDEARRLLDEHQRQLDQARREAKDILQQGREAGERLREEILTQARRENEELLERARRDLVREKEDLLESVRREAVDLSLAAAERLLRERLDDDANRQLVREYITELE
jgi:F-type H+-transporting ATPase subunit b